VGQWIDLAESRRHITAATETARIEHKHRAPAYFQFEPPPLRITEPITPIEVAGRVTTENVETVLFDFGVVSLNYLIPFSGRFGDLVQIGAALSEDDLLRKDALRRVEALLQVVRTGVSKPNLSELMEDYVVFQIADWDAPCPLPDLLARHGETIARILRAETGALSQEETQDALSARIAYGPDDLTLIDWNAALIIDPDAEDVRAVLEFANAELLEMRFLDRQLDVALDQAYDVLSARRWRAFRSPVAWGTDLRRVGQMQVDAAILYERVTNALKLLGDQYLARLYQHASQRFHLRDWNASILRKLDTIESIYRKIHDRAATLRMEVLEWIIIILIAVSIVFPMLSWFPD
jgi:hypothetical protein